MQVPVQQVLASGSSSSALQKPVGARHVARSRGVRRCAGWARNGHRHGGANQRAAASASRNHCWHQGLFARLPGQPGRAVAQS